MLKEHKRILIVYCLLGLPGLATLACGSRSGLVASTSRDGGVSTQIRPLDDGSCPVPSSLCGVGAGTRCYNLNSDPLNCGTCGRTCTPGIACAAGTCQQPKCTGPVSFQQIASFPATLVPSSTETKDALMFDGYQGADMNRDGRLDLIEANWGGDIVIWLGQGDGTFVASTSYATLGNAETWALPDYAAVGDFNEDGLADLVVTRADNDKVEVRPGLSGGGLGGRPGLPLPRVLMADLDSDGHLDVIDGHRDKDGYPTGFTVLRGRGNGTFAAGSSYEVRSSDRWFPSELRDWDNDGILDLLGFGMTLRILLGKGDGTFAEPLRCALGFQFETGAFLDLNLDDKLDAVWVLWPGQIVTTVLGSSDCNFTPRTDYQQPFQPGVLGIGDYSGDGVPDLVLPSQEGSNTVLLLGQGDGAFVAQPALALDMYGRALFIADVTDDGVPDIVATGNRGVVVFANTCPH